MRIANRERRDWTLIIFIIPIGIILMMIAGQIAVRIVPQWSVNAGMKSVLDPQTAPKQQIGLIQPVLPEILTPIGWLDTFLTPDANSGDQAIAFPPFIVFKPTATPSPTSTPVASPTVTETPTASASPSPSPTTVTTVPSATKTKKPPVDTNTPKPPTSTATPITPTVTATPTATGTPSTPDPSLTLTAVAVDTTGTPDGSITNFNYGSYVVLNLGVSVHVAATPDNFYDLVYYESAYDSTTILMDNVILGISTVGDGSYYEVFNWGNGTPDNNTNVGDVAGAETDNQSVNQSELYPSPPAPTPNTGILIDVDNAPGKPPPGDYNYLVIISPNTGSPGDGAQVDAVEVTEVPIPTPTP